MFDIHLLINLFFSLIELKHQIKEHTCKFKIDKTTYSKSWSRATYDVSKNRPLVYR